MNNWHDINEVNLYYIKYNILPNLISFGIAYAYYNEINLDCSLKEYINNVISLFNIYNIQVKDQIKLVDNILLNRYKLMVINTEKIEIIDLGKMGKKN